jgi:hypothetical protein
MREMKPEALVELLGAVKGAQRRADNVLTGLIDARNRGNDEQVAVALADLHKHARRLVGAAEEFARVVRPADSGPEGDTGEDEPEPV